MIDWFTVTAQIVNFIVLIVLLRIVLYRRIVEAIQKREQQMASRWEEAQRALEQAQQQRAEAEAERRRFEEQRQQLLKQVRAEVEQFRQELTRQVREEAEQLRHRWAEALRQESAAFLRDLRQQTLQELCNIARRALGDLADASLEEQVAKKFITLLEQLDDGPRDEILAAIREGQRAVVVQTRFELPDELRGRITDALRRKLVDDLDVRFERSDDQICGVAMQTNAHTLSWELGDYLRGLEQQLSQALSEQTTAMTAAEVETAVR